MNEKRCIHGTKGTKSKETDEAKLSHTVPIVQSIGPGLGKGQGQENQTTVEVNGCILYPGEDNPKFEMAAYFLSIK